MANVLTSWKEIGQYLGKGVRTVQRWERESGLAVRRPAPPSRRAVLAIPEEIDAWARSQAQGQARPLIESLSREIAELRATTHELRTRLEAIEGSAKPPRKRSIRAVGSAEPPLASVLRGR